MNVSENLPVSAFDQVTKSGICVVVVVIFCVVVVVGFAVLNFGCDVVVDAWLEVDEIVVRIGFFFCGGVGLVPDDVIIVGCVDDPSFVPVDWVPTKNSFFFSKKLD